MSSPSAGLPIRRNTALLAASLTMSSGMLQLVAALSSVTFVLVTGIEGLLGLGPAIFLTAAGLSAFPAGRAMDHFGRVPVLAAGFASGVAGSGLTALGAGTDSAPAVIGGFVLIGIQGATAALARAAGGDLYPPERRARGISLVLFGAVFGAILGPAVFAPLFAGRELQGDELVVPWLAGAGFGIAGIVLVLFVRPDPRRIAELIGYSELGASAPPPASLRQILGRPGVIPALVAGVASFSVMVAVMNLTGFVVVDHHHHHQQAVFPIVGAHVLGMYALVLFVGDLVDRVGRRSALVSGLLVMAISCVLLIWAQSVWATAVLLFWLGLGWNVSWVAAAAELVDCTSPFERGKLLGFGDLLGALTGAGLALLGGFALEALGVAALALGAAALAVLPVLWLLRSGRAPHEPALATISDH